MAKRTPGLTKRRGIWHIDKTFRRRRICESTGEGDLAEAQIYLARRIEEVRQQVIYGVRPKRIFRQAATKYLNDNPDKPRISDDALHLKQLDRYIGDLPLDAVSTDSLKGFIEARRKQKVKTRTINIALGIVRHVLNLAATEWRDGGLTWLASAPKIKLPKVKDSREPYPLSRDEERTLFSKLPVHLARMALFKVNTGTREAEVCRLRWDWEVPVPELKTSVFIIPAEHTKNSEERLVVLNQIAKSVIEQVRGQHEEYVFTYNGHPVSKMNNTAWRSAREKAGLLQVRVHDLKHTFGRRLRSMGVSFEDRQDLLGHKSARITTHYSGAELLNLIEAANRVCTTQTRKSPALVLLKRGRRG